VEKVASKFGYFCPNTAQKNYHPRGENSPNLVYGNSTSTYHQRRYIHSIDQQRLIVAPAASHPPQEQKARVRILPGCKIFKENKLMTWNALFVSVCLIEK
jgi:hypothetical protein